MKIALFTEHFPPNTSGGAIVRERFAEIATEEEHDVVVYTPKIKDTPSFEESNGYKIKRPFRAKPEGLPTHSIWAFPLRVLFSLLLLLYCIKDFYKNDYDLIISTDYVTHLPAKILQILYKIKYFTFVGYTPSINEEMGVGLQIVLERFNFLFCMGDAVFCRTYDTKNIIEKYGSKNVQVIHGVVNQKRINEVLSERQWRIREEIPWNIDKNDKILVTVGRLSPIKNVSSAICVLSKLPVRYKLVIIGDGPTRTQVERKISELGINDRVFLTGMVTHQTALQWIAQSDGLLLTSKAEAYPSVVFEALYMGTPVFATPVGILKDMDESLLTTSDVDQLAYEIQNFQMETPPNSRSMVDYTVENFTHSILRAARPNEEERH